MLKELYIFGKAQVSSFTGGIVDYLLMIIFTETFHVHYTASIAIGGVFGAMINFYLNKKWVFFQKDFPYQHKGWRQLLRFVLMVASSILTKALGTYFFTTFLKTDYIIGRIITDLSVSLAINYTLQRHWVFKKKCVKATINQDLS